MNFINLLKSAAFSLQTSENLKPPKNQIEGQQWTITRGSYVLIPMVKFLGAFSPKKKKKKKEKKQISQNIDGFTQNNSQGL